MQHAFNEMERMSVYKAIFERRDIRSQFLADPIPAEVLQRLLRAAHAAPSVGFMQPWDFIIIQDQTIKQQVKTIFDVENDRAATNYQDEKGALYRRLKLEGIIESPINICMTCHRERGGKHVLGRNSIIDMDLFSTCLAVQNFWLAARAEGIGVGWVSIMDNDALARILNLPDKVYPLAYLCVGYVSEFPDQPELEKAGWRARLALDELIHYEGW